MWHVFPLRQCCVPFFTEWLGLVGDFILFVCFFSGVVMSLDRANWDTAAGFLTLLAFGSVAVVPGNIAVVFAIDITEGGPS